MVQLGPQAEQGKGWGVVTESVVDASVHYDFRR